MKVIKASVDLKTWCLKHTCDKCKSELEICASDIRYSYDRGYYAICVLCSNVMTIKKDEVPEIVKADVDKHRRDKSYSSFD